MKGQKLQKNQLNIKISSFLPPPSVTLAFKLKDYLEEISTVWDRKLFITIALTSIFTLLFILQFQWLLFLSVSLNLKSRGEVLFFYYCLSF